MDQLHDSPSEDSVLFIHWFVFTSHLSAAINKSAIISAVYTWMYIKTTREYIPAFIFGFHATPIAASTCFSCMLHLFGLPNINTSQGLWLTLALEIPIQTSLQGHQIYKTTQLSNSSYSAFTYCEDELPSRMDLGKEKYGGPFTTEPVEDVKAFYGILRVY